MKTSVQQQVNYNHFGTEHARYSIKCLIESFSKINEYKKETM